jgi:3-oxoacyl-[acyl-carrier protein] reductase
MNLGLAGRVALVNGASQGIGYGIAHTLAEEGARLAITARRAPALQAAAERITRETGAEVLPIQCDIRCAADCERAVATTVDHFGALHALINNDGAPPLGGLLEFGDEAWRKAVEQNLMSVVRLTRAVVPHMKTAGGGSILNITAISMLEPKPGFGLSVATWAAVMGFAKTASIELGRDCITINTIAPGLVETPRLHKVTEQSGKVMGDFAAGIPLGRVGTPADIAALVALLVSPRGAYITGTTIPVDGGLLAGVR